MYIYSNSSYANNCPLQQPEAFPNQAKKMNMNLLLLKHNTDQFWHQQTHPVQTDLLKAMSQSLPLEKNLKSLWLF